MASEKGRGSCKQIRMRDEPFLSLWREVLKGVFGVIAVISLRMNPVGSLIRICTESGRGFAFVC